MPGMVRLKQLKDLELYYDAPAGLTMQVLSDVVGNVQGALAVAATLNFPATAGRQTFTLPLDNIYGTLVQFHAASGGVVKLFGGVLRVLDIGVWFFGGNGEVWDSLPLSIGI